MFRKSALILLTLAALPVTVLWLSTSHARLWPPTASPETAPVQRGPMWSFGRQGRQPDTTCGLADGGFWLRRARPVGKYTTEKRKDLVLASVETVCVVRGCLVSGIQSNADPRAALANMRDLPDVKLADGTIRTGPDWLMKNVWPTPAAPAVPLRPTYRLVTTIHIPLWGPLVLLLAWPTVAFLRGPLRRWRRRRKGLCLACGYDLTGNVSGVCPECGEAI